MAHDQKVTHSYLIHYPDHGPRIDDPHYVDFETYKRRRKTDSTYWCDFAKEHRNGDFSECATGPLECHHKIIEFALMNSVDLVLLEKDYPGVSAPGLGAWVESADNLMLLCAFHHRGHGGVHIASASDWTASQYIRKMIS